MRITIFACIGLIVVGGASVSAQNTFAPPGFTPGLEDENSPSPPQPPRFYSGSDADSNTFSEPYLGRPSRHRLDGGDIGRGRTFRRPALPELVLDEPALPRVFFRAESLIWWTKSSPLSVPIVTLGNQNDPTPGAMGQPGTSVLIGDQSVGFPTRGGARFTFGFSLDPAQVWGLEASYFSLASSTVSQGVSSDGSPGSSLLAFPFYNPTIPGEDASPIALPGSFAGTAVLSLKSFLQGVDVNLVHNIHNSSGVRFDLLGGFRYINLQEQLLFTTESPSYSGYFNTFDQFKTTSNFYGGQVGVRGSYDIDRFFFNATGKLAIGATSETVSVNGGTFTNIGGYASAPGAYLSQPTNMGSQSSSHFAVAPEMNLNVGFRLRPWASIMVGYSFLYISSVARPGDQIDRVVNPTQAPAINNVFPGNLSGPTRPELNVHNSDFWAQGLNLSLEFRF